MDDVDEHEGERAVVDDSTVEDRTTSGHDVLDLAEIGTFMNMVFPDKQEKRDRERPQVQIRASQPDVDLDLAETLIARASKAIEVLAARCEIMEHDLADAAERIAEHEEAAAQWRNVTIALQTQAASDQETIEELRARAESAETRARSLEAAGIEADRRLALADARSSRLRGQVITAFGRQSPIHSVLQAVTLQEAAE